MVIASFVAMSLLYAFQSWGKRNILDILNAIVASMLAGYYFKIPGFVIYLSINIMLLKLEELRVRDRYR